MTITLENVGAIIGIVMFAALIVRVAVVTPLGIRIGSLEETIKNMRTDLGDLRNKISAVEKETSALRTKLEDHIGEAAKVL